MCMYVVYECILAFISVLRLYFVCLFVFVCFCLFVCLMMASLIGNKTTATTLCYLPPLQGLGFRV